MGSVSQHVSAHRRLWFLLLIFVVIAVYAPMLHAPYKTMDDEVSIVANDKIRSFANTPSIFSSAFFGDHGYYRPLVTFSFLLEFQAFGLVPFFYNFDNLLLHLLNAFCVWGLLRRLLKDESSAFFAAALFAVHPIQWEAVSNISGRAILLCALFTINTFAFYIDWLRDRKPAALAGTLVCFTLGLLSKEAAGILPMVVIVYTVLAAGRERERGGWILPLAGYAILTGLYIFARRTFGITELFSWPSLREATLGVISSLRGILTFLQLFVWPADLHFDRSQRLFLTFRDPGVWRTIAVYGAFVLALVASRKHWTRLTIFLLLWFFLELLPVMQIVTSIGVYPGYISVAEHFVYVPSIAFFALAVGGLKELAKAAEARRLLSRLVLQALMATGFAACALVTCQQAIYASSEIAMLRRSLDIQPQNGRLQYALGLAYVMEKLYPSASDHFREVLKIYPYDVKVRIAYARTMYDQGKYLEAVREYERVVEPGDFKTLLENNKRLAYRAVVTQYEKKITDRPNDGATHFLLGVAYTRLGEPEKALDHFEKAYRFDPANVEAVFNLASLYETMRQYDRSAAAYEDVLRQKTREDLRTYAAEHLAQVKAHREAAAASAAKPSEKKPLKAQ